MIRKIASYTFDIGSINIFMLPGGEYKVEIFSEIADKIFVCASLESAYIHTIFLIRDLRAKSRKQKKIKHKTHINESSRKH